MNKYYIKFSIIILALMLVGCTPADGEKPTNPQPISGKIINGYRIIELSQTSNKLSLTVYRGDYIKFQVDGTVKNATLSIPDLNIQKKLDRNISDAPFFKMKSTGSFSFSIGDVAGILYVIDYDQPYYREVTAREAAEMIKDGKPLILDVRTPGEYKRGHLKDAALIPVQELRARLKELLDYKEQEILVYCATGNRSTVASKILNDNGHKHIINMRHGIVEWQKNNYPVER